MDLKSLFLSFLFLFAIFGLTSSAPSLQDCNQEITKMTQCLDYSSGKAATPTEKCCTSVKEIRNEKPVCLCFIIEQTYEGLSTLKQLGLKVDRLLQLPTDCKLVNASASDCPRLLELSPSSPSYSIFTNSSKVSPSSDNQDTAVPKSNGFKTMSYFMVTMVMVFLSMFSIKP